MSNIEAKIEKAISSEKSVVLDAEQTSGSHDGVRHCIPLDRDGHAAGDWGDEGERYFIDTIRPSTLQTLVDFGHIQDAVIVEIDADSDAPWTLVERLGLRPPRPGARDKQDRDAGEVDLTEISGVSEERAERLRAAFDLEALADAVDDDDRLVSMIATVDGFGVSLARRVVSRLRDRLVSASTQWSDDDRIKAVAKCLRDGGAVDDVVSCAPKLEPRHVAQAQNRLEKPRPEVVTEAICRLDDE